MIFVLIVLWLAAIILLATNFGDPAVRWLAAVAFCGGSGAMASVIEDFVRPFAARHELGLTADWALYIALTIFSLISYYGLPYCYVRFAGHYHPGRLKPRVWRMLRYALLLPPVLMLLFTQYYPPNYTVLTLWAAPYILFGTVLLLSKREWEPWRKQAHWMVTLVVVPAVVFALVMNYILPGIFGIYDMWRYNIWTILLAFTLFVVALFKYGFLGVQLLIERRKLDMTMRAITSGTAILNHAIKNDLAKVRLFCDKIQTSALQTGQGELASDVAVIERAADHVQELLDRVHHRTQDIALKKERHSLKELVEEALRMLEPMMAQIRILWKEDDGAAAEIICDRAQTLEVLNNIITNAVEAMPRGGTLTVAVTQTKKTWTVEIRDTGTGIEKDKLRKVLEPFYTTKTGSKRNFGLGLAYCYQVMKKHGGTLEIDSVPKQGTGVYLHFPKGKGGAKPHERDSSHDRRRR